MAWHPHTYYLVPQSKALLRGSIFRTVNSSQTFSHRVATRSQPTTPGSTTYMVARPNTSSPLRKTNLNICMLLLTRHYQLFTSHSQLVTSHYQLVTINEHVLSYLCTLLGTTKRVLPRVGFEPWICNARSVRSTHWATPTNQRDVPVACVRWPLEW